MKFNPATRRNATAKGKTKMNTENQSAETGSRLWVAVMLSITAIFSSYAISVVNHQKDQSVNANSQFQRPVAVSYLA
jgi:hypothetical protein